MGQTLCSKLVEDSRQHLCDLCTWLIISEGPDTATAHRELKSVSKKVELLSQPNKQLTFVLGMSGDSKGVGGQ